MDYSANALRATIRALDTVVRPVVEAADDAQARDQLALALDGLRFLELRLADLPARASFSSRLCLSLARSLADDVEPTLPEVAARLRSAADGADWAAGAGEHVDGDARTAELLGEIREVLRSWPSWQDGALRRDVARAVLASERRRIEADRAWFAPMGFDPDPGSVPTLAAAWELPGAMAVSR